MKDVINNRMCYKFQLEDIEFEPESPARTATPGMLLYAAYSC